MLLTHLSLTNFRNFIRLETELPVGPTVLFGSNAQGKTNLLEAIHYLTGIPPVQARSDRQLINFLAMQQPSPFARIAAEVKASNRLQRVEIRILLEDSRENRELRTRKEALLNGVKRRMRELAGAFNAVLFVPQDMRVPEGTPGERRRHLDAVLSQADPTYAKALAEYSRVLSQRNALLKQLLDRNAQEDQLEFWDHRLADLGATLIRTRALGLRDLEAYARPVHKTLTAGGTTLRFEYLPAYNPLQGKGIQMELPAASPVEWAAVGRDQIYQGMLSSLQENRPAQIARGATLSGPHRDDFRFLADGIDLRYYGSRGENRSAMLAAKLAEVEWLKERTGEWPVLLFDEVLAELDTDRRKALLDCVGAAQQAILTTADLDMFNQSFLNQATIWEIADGRISPRSD